MDIYLDETKDMIAKAVLMVVLEFDGHNRGVAKIAGTLLDSGDFVVEESENLGALALEDVSFTDIRKVIEELVDDGYLELTGDAKYPTIGITDGGRYALEH